MKTKKIAKTRNIKKSYFCSGILTTVLALAASCGGPDEGPELGCSEQGLTSPNGLMANGLEYDSLVHNIVSPANRQLLEYTVSCALPAHRELSVEVDGETLTFHGAIGLAPEWAEGACDETCRGWISACLLSRVNAKGEHRTISMRGSHPALAVSEREASNFPRPEATYFGDLSARPRQVHACLPDGATGISRVCGESLDECFLSIAGYCSDVCRDGVCTDVNGRSYAQTISVHLPSEELADRCGY